MATSLSLNSGSYYGGLTLLSSTGTHLWTYGDNYGSGTYYQWKNLEYSGSAGKGVMCGQSSDYLSLVMIYFTFSSSSVTASTTFYTDTATQKTCAGLYTDSAITEARILFHDFTNKYYLHIYVPSLTSAGSAISGITSIASDMPPISKGTFYNSNWFFVGNGQNVGVQAYTYKVGFLNKLNSNDICHLTGSVTASAGSSPTNNEITTNLTGSYSISSLSYSLSSYTAYFNSMGYSTIV